jgi:hypothetical protein
MDWIWIEIATTSECETRSAWYEVVHGRLVLRHEDGSAGVGIDALGFEGLSLDEAKRRVEAMQSHVPSISMWRHYAVPDWLSLSTEVSECVVPTSCRMAEVRFVEMCA